MALAGPTVNLVIAAVRFLFLDGGMPVDSLAVSNPPAGFLARLAAVNTTQHEFPVIDGAGRLRGVLTRDEMIRALKERGPQAPWST